MGLLSAGAQFAKNGIEDRLLRRHEVLEIEWVGHLSSCPSVFSSQLDCNTRQCSSPTEKVFCPLLIIVGSGDLSHQLGRRDVLEFAGRYTLAQRFQRVINRLYCSRERGMGLQCDPDPMRCQPVEIAELAANAAKDQGILIAEDLDRLDCGSAGKED